MIIFEETTNYFNLQGNTSGIAENVFLTKYALTDEEGNILEKTPTQMFRRHAKALAEIEKNKGYKDISPYSEDELFEFFTEKFENYIGDERDYGGIILQGRPAFGIGNDHQFVSLLNCFILPPPEDSIGGISVREQEIIQIAKRGGGCGLVMDTIRPIGSSTKNSSRTTTGLISFMEQYSLAVERIGQNGRRGALLMGLHMNHPEIKNFITCKNKKDSVNHANLPIFVSDDNMRDIEAGNPIKLEFNGQNYGEIDSKELWDLITSSMWNSGDPGLMFWSEHQRNSISDCYGDDWKIISCNPCAEIHGAPYQSCLLLSLNLYRFVENPFTPLAKFNFDKFKRYVFAAVRIGDDIVDLEEQKINSILRKIENDPESEEVKSVEYNLWKKILEKLLLSRKIGVGFTALADCLAALNLKYDFNEGIEMILRIGRALRDNSYQASVDLAKDIGTFPIFDFEKEESANCEFLTRIYNDCPDLKEQTRKYGRRNMTLNTCAPTGTISLCAGVSAGIEPVFSLIETRMKKASFVDDSKKDLYHTDSEGILWEKYQIKHPKLKKWEMMNPGKTEHPYVEAYDVNYKKRVELQGRINKYIDNSISSTVNLPEDITPEEISEVLFAAWKSGCKGITVFRENSRMAVKSRTDNDSNDEIWPNGVYKRPKSIPAECMHMTYNKEPYVLIVGLVKGNPYETWIWKIEDKLIFPYGAKNFHIVKERKGKYILTWDKRTDEDPGNLSISDLQVDNSLIFAFTRLISAFLRHNPNELEVLISTFEKMPQFDSIPKLIARLLKKYLKDGTRIYGLQCPTCEHALTRKSGCVFCENCGYSVCS